MSPKARPVLFTADAHGVGKGVDELVKGQNVTSHGTPAARRYPVVGGLFVLPVDRFAIVVHGLPELVGIFPSMLIIQRKPGCLR